MHQTAAFAYSSAFFKANILFSGLESAVYFAVFLNFQIFRRHRAVYADLLISSKRACNVLHDGAA